MSPPRALRLPAASLARLEAWRVAGGCEEVCGLLVGRRRGETLEVRRVERLPNRAADRRAAFLLDPGAHVAVEEAARAAGLEVLGAWHTHPAGAPHPSAADADGAWPDRVTLIGAAAGARSQWAAWWPAAGSGGPVPVGLHVDRDSPPLG